MRLVRWLVRAALGIAACVLLLSLIAGGYAYYRLREALPLLEGNVNVAGLSAPASVARDAAGVPLIQAANRADLARALGFLHGQERFFQMDLLRRAGAGELAALLGNVALPADRVRRVHRFRARAAAVLAGLTLEETTLLRAYAAGVNAGLAALQAAPWEYVLLRVRPKPWTEADTVLVVDAMYFDLQQSGPAAQVQRAAATAFLGPSMADFLFPQATDQDAPIDGSVLPEPPIPASATPAAGTAPLSPPPTPGSNNFAVAGRLTATGSAMLENDMHLALRVPNIWFRAEMRMPGGPDLVGVTLPGVPFLVVGSNQHVAWGFTDSYTETGDAVALQMLPGTPARYATPGGPLPVETHSEQICVAYGGCEPLAVRDTIWGPIEGRDAQGRELAWRWVAHDPNSVRVGGMMALERAGSVDQAIAAAHTAGIPAQNLLLADRAGHIAWTIIGQVPQHVGLEDRVPQSWADGQRGWRGYVPAAEVPQIVDPPGGRLWSANARVVGGAALSMLGDGDYAWGARAAKIRDDLIKRDRFAETDLLAIANETGASVLEPWRKLMLSAIAAHAGTADFARMQPYVQRWGGHAVPDSVGYRLVRRYEQETTNLVYAGLTGSLAEKLGDDFTLPGAAARPAERMLEARPGWVPAPYHDWDGLTGAALAGVQAEVAGTPGGLPAFRWGAVNRTGIRQPLSGAVPGLSWLTDPPDQPVAGDRLVPRVAVPGHGASERMVVSPGHEASGIMEMPAGQSDNPLSPYYLAGQEAWVAGTPAPLLPGPARWHLQLLPEMPAR